jgi:hypothetical protein
MPHYRTPGNSEFVEALGWAVWNFLYLEETIIRWLWLLAPGKSLSQWRSDTAFGKGVELGREAKAAHLPPELYADIQTWLRRYEAMVADARNGIMHAHAYTVSNGPDGWVPGLNYTDGKGSEHRIAESPAELHAIAGRIEQLMIELSGMEPRLQAALDAREIES